MMTLSQPLSRSFVAGALALVYTGLTFGAAITPTAAEARSKPVYYTAELASPAAETRSVVGGVVWVCEGTRCVAAKGNSRPVIMCKRVAKEFGSIAKFTAKGEELQADKLAKCNG